MQLVRLKGVVHHADFRKNEATLWAEFQKKYEIQLGKNQCVLFVSSVGNQLLFILGSTEMQADSKTRQVIDSRRWRLLGGSWSPDMLQNYANSVGLRFEGIKRFEELYADRQLRKRLESVVGY